MKDQTQEALLLTQVDAAKLLGVHHETLRRLASAGVLTPVYLHEKAHPRFRRADIERLVNGLGSS